MDKVFYLVGFLGLITVLPIGIASFVYFFEFSNALRRREPDTWTELMNSIRSPFGSAITAVHSYLREGRYLALSDSELTSIGARAHRWNRMASYLSAAWMAIMFSLVLGRIYFH